MLTEKLFEIANIGAEWVLWLLLLLSVGSLAIIGERIAFYLRVGVDVEAMRRKLVSFLERGDYEGAQKHFAADASMEATVLHAGLAGHALGATSAGELMNGAMATEKVRYERFLGFLATVGSNTPYLGLFGTVLGIIQAFAALDLSGGAQVDNRIMGAIAEALVATGVGLFVAIPAIVAFNFFKVRVKNTTATTDKLARTLLAHLSAEPASAAAATGEESSAPTSSATATTA